MSLDGIQRDLYGPRRRGSIDERTSVTSAESDKESQSCVVGNGKTAATGCCLFVPREVQIVAEVNVRSFILIPARSEFPSVRIFSRRAFP